MKAQILVDPMYEDSVWQALASWIARTAADLRRAAPLGRRARRRNERQQPDC